MNRPAPWRSIMDSVGDRRPFRVGGATVDLVSRDARWKGGQERLQPQTLKVLQLLVSRRGDVVTRDELVQLCWDGRIVGDDVINRSILLLRHFAERAGGFEIETVPRTGYRLVETTASPLRSGRRRWLIAASATAVLAVIAVGVIERPAQKVLPPAPAAPPIIELMPFTANPADGEAQKLAAATREAAANSLSQGAYSVRTDDVRAGSLRGPADFVISGQLTRMPGKTVASVRMEEEQHHIIVFSHQFEADSDNAWALPDQVAAQLASQLSWTAPFIAVERRHPSDPAVMRQFFEQSATGLEGAGSLADYENSRRLAMAAPNSPLAQMDFAYTTAFAMDQLPLDQRQDAARLARRASDRAVALAPQSGDAPWCMLHSEVRAGECEDKLRKDMRVDPDAPFAGWFLANLVLNPVGRNTEAAELARLSLAHDPYMPNKIGLMLRMLEITGQTAEAEQLYRQSTRWWPGEDDIIWRRFSGMIERGDFESAMRFYEQTRAKSGPDPVLLAVNRGGVAGVRTACAKAQDFDSIICMLAFARLGDLDSAFALADALYPARRGRDAADQNRIWLENPSPNSVAFLTGPGAAPLRRDSRFLKLAEGLGLLDYWRSGRLPDFCTKAHEPVCAEIAGNGSGRKPAA